MLSNPEQNTDRNIDRVAEHTEAPQKLAGLAIERLTPPEFLPRQYGMEHTFVDLPLRSINALNQVRRGRNDQQSKKLA
jgi:hypothetical protein